MSPAAREKRLRILVGKLGLDGHDRGAKVVATILRDAGMEVIYTGLRRTAGEVVAAAVQEDVDVIGLSILSGAHLSLVQDVLDELKRNDAGSIPVIVGGTVPVPDMARLKEMGVAEVFGVRSDIGEMPDRIRALVPG